MEGSEQPEGMAEFFDARAAGYEQHMGTAVRGFDQFYRAVAAPIPETDVALRILDLGCGTGLELDTIFQKAPRAVVIGIDISEAMLSLLEAKYAGSARHVYLKQDSYIGTSFPDGVYDFIVAVMTLHHLLPNAKRGLFIRAQRALRRSGALIVGDWFVSQQEEVLQLSNWRRRTETLRCAEMGRYHIDVPLSLDTERRLLVESGFSTVSVIWQTDDHAVYVCRL